MGQMVDRTYLVQNGNLVVRDNNQPIVLDINPLVLVNGIVAIRAQYGRDTTVPPDGFVDSYDNNATAPTSLSTPAEIASRQTEVVSIRLAVVARSGQQERENVSPDPVILWSGGTLSTVPLGNGGALSLDRTYRYKVYQTIIPLRNVVWNTP